MVGGPGRNAWRDLWIHLPGTVQWKKAGFHRVDLNKPSGESDRLFRLETPEAASAAMAAGLKNALALLEKASNCRHGIMSRRADLLPDD